MMTLRDAPMIGVHLDLKYMMPSQRYLARWIRQLAQRGINTLLIEYEDKFPFNKHRFLRDPQAFTTHQLQSFLATAREAGLRVVPLVQTLSHLEFALGHNRLAGLREAPDIPTQICPCNPDAIALVHDLLDDILAAHQGDAWIHLGADEAWFMGTCPACRARLEAVGKIRFWADHMRPLIRRAQAAGKQVMVWDDIFWNHPDSVTDADLPPGLALVAWNYSAQRFPPDGDLDRRVAAYRQAGCDAIGAPCLNWGVLLPQHDHCLGNTTGWVRAAQRLNLAGVLNTAWACFHVPIPMQWLYESATAAAFDHATDPMDDAWQADQLQAAFGCAPAGFPQALRHLSVLWEHPVEGLGRPVTPIGYGNMDMVLHYPGGQDERRRRGAYPLDWNEIDFNRLLQTKARLLRQTPDRDGVIQRLDQLQSGFEEARAAILSLQRRARRGRRQIALLRCLAELKILSAAVMRCLVAEDGAGRDETGLLLEMASLRTRLAGALSPFYEPPSVERADRLWIEPLVTAMRRRTG